jgi:predicted RNA methylase
MGSYDPPFGFVGRRADVMLLHHVAEASVRSFLARLARDLERPVRALRIQV